MENPVSSTPNHRKSPDEIVGAQDLVLYFGSLKFGRDGNLKSEDAGIGKNSKKIKNQCDVAQETSVKTLSLPENSVPDHGSIWGHQFFLTEEENFVSNAHNYGQESLRSCKDCRDCYVDSCKPENFDAGSSIQQPRMEPCCGYPTMSNCVSQFENKPVFYEVSGFRPTSLYHYENDQFRQVTNNGFYYGKDYCKTNNDLTSSCQWNQQDIHTFPQAKPRFNLGFLYEILEGGDYEQIQRVLVIFQGSYLSLMTDKIMFIVFQKLVDACRGEQLNIVVTDVLSWSQSFIDAAFCKQGASSIVRLIKKLKKSNHAFTMTEVLSTRFLAMMTHDVARVVIQHCFIYFGNQPNKILYEKAIYHFQELAVDKVGCRALNDIINTIAGEQRLRLLNNVADCAAYLSNDFYGNYVVQNVLSLKNQDVCARLVLSLQGQFVQLAKQTGGSHVVEKCMDSFDLGVVAVVQEILDMPSAPFQLAQDNFGNYVIQKALKKTKEHGFRDLYDSLVKSLLPHRQELNQTTGGKNVLNLLRDDGRLEWPTLISGKERAMRRWM